ncbi:hypothetical protein Rhe02_37180 [Rhizocola hellebori]|uniref:DUF1700 domain-containing protein n=2 Tax=Rhizocola hellebori TaxID=1392758 RepID=A0A8J3VH45_9ACTN|nr:hypothetical protein Rhe02_37180 [Rhizocola hellebori]
MTTHHPIVAEYLHRLHEETADLPVEERAELVSSIAEHITTALAEITDPQEADIQAVLDRLGPPAAIATEARRQSSGAPVTRTRPGALEWGGVAMLGVGSYLLPIIGTAAGLVMIALSPWWTARQKLAAAAISLTGLVLVPLVGMGLFLVSSSTYQEQSPVPIESVFSPSHRP